MMSLNPILKSKFLMFGVSTSWDHSQIHSTTSSSWLDYVSKWVEVVPTKTNDNKVVIKFLKENIFSRCGTPRAIISDNGSHFCNKVFEVLMRKYSINHKLSTLYHPQTNGQVEVTFQNRLSDKTERIGRSNSTMYCGLTALLLRQFWGYLLIESYLKKPVIYQSSQNNMPYGPLSNSILI